MRKIFYGLSFIVLGWILVAQPILAREDAVIAIISVFVRSDCTHCQDEKEFLSQLKTEFPSLVVKYYDLDDQDNHQLFQRFTKQFGLVQATPITLVQGRIIQGFDSEQTTGRLIRSLIDQSPAINADFEEFLISQAGSAQKPDAQFSTCVEGEPCVDEGVFQVTIPFTQQTLNLSSYSLPVLSIILGFIDGFNPCAMWVLVMFLIILSQLDSRRKMLLYAGLFIVAEAIMYSLILNVWLTVWDFVTLDRLITPAVGILAIGSGIYFLHKFIYFQFVCPVTSPEQRQRISQRAQELANSPLTAGVIAGILVLAFSVNIFEFACSIGIPQTYTKILDLNSLHWLAKQFQVGLYILMYMVDDLVVFGLAMYSFDKIGLTHQYSRWTSLVGGLMMLVLGLMMLLNPALLIL